ncbi:MAG: hypothetical protein DRJ01_09010 [Bacteroidetes bacterium]|nr:MAG: hypothetical protein DRJ01_09010 [Bacteroidota bacterium]
MQGLELKNNSPMRKFKQLTYNEKAMIIIAIILIIALAFSHKRIMTNAKKGFNIFYSTEKIIDSTKIDTISKNITK